MIHGIGKRETKQLLREVESMEILIATARRKKILGPGVMTEKDFQNLKAAINLEEAGVKWLTSNKKYYIEKLDATMKETEKIWKRSAQNNKYQGGVDAWDKVYFKEIDNNIQDTLGATFRGLEDSFSAYDKKPKPVKKKRKEYKTGYDY